MTSEQPQLLSVRSECAFTTQSRVLTVASATKPQYSRTQSLQSSAASNEYFSDYASDSVSTKSDLSKASYETPPSRISTPNTQQPQIDSEMTLPARPGAARPAPLATRNNGGSQHRTLSSFDNMSPPTPGVDDAPYIRFAIEQLTRDEDVMGHGRHGSLTSNEPTAMGTVPEEESEEQAIVGPPLAPETQPLQTPPTPQRPISRRPVPEEVLLAVHPPDGQRWADLGSVPTPLRSWALGLYIFLCLLMIAGLIFSNVFALRNYGLYDYDGNATPRYFVFQYLPQLLGILLILWLFVIEAAMYRTIPYLLMSADHNNNHVQGLRITPANFVLPDLSWFRKGEPLLGITFFTFWLMNFTVPLLSCLFQTRWIINDGPSRWRWTPVQDIGWVLLVLYITFVLALVYCLIRFRSTKSALMWDPTSLADLIVLFRRSNICHDFERTEVSETLKGRIPTKFLRLGYWMTTQRPEIFHGIGEENAAIKRLTVDFPTIEKVNDSQDSSFDMERQRYSDASSFTRDIHSPFVRYRWAPWFLRDSAVVAWIVIAILLALAFLVVSFVNDAVQRGFRPLLSSRADSSGFSSSNFLYSFLPALLGMVLFLVWQPIDAFFRHIQPFANLASPSGATAERSLLSSYPSFLPGEVTVQALANRDFKVAYISFVGVMALTIPVLAGGVFTAQLFRGDGQVRMAASMPGYIALCVFTTVYALSYLAVWPTRKRYLPHSSNTVADLLSFLYASPLLSEAGLSNIRTKADLVGRFVGAPVGLTGDGKEKRASARYGFGIYVGRDGIEHLGLDRLQRPGSGEMLILTGMSR
jgi:Protein of unknown function (DUF3433)